MGAHHKMLQIYPNFSQIFRGAYHKAQAVATALLSTVCCCSLQAEVPDPSALIEGVLFARSQVGAESFHLHCIATGPTVRNDRRYLVDFESSFRRFWVTNAEVQSRMILNETNILQYSPANGDIVIAAHDEPTAALLFDPRILGITPSYSIDHTVDSLLDLKRCSQVRIVGQKPEAFGDAIAWQVRMEYVTPATFTKDIWIDPKSFRVLKAVTDVPGHWTSTSISEYSVFADGILPTSVTTRMVNASGNLMMSWEMQISGSESKRSLPPETWMIQGLGAPNETPVIDKRLMTRIGTWDGSRIIPEVSPPKGGGAEAERGLKRNLGIVVLIGILSFPLIMHYRKKKTPETIVSG